MHNLSIAKWLWLACSYSLSVAGDRVELKAPSHLPPGSSQPVDHAFASFSWPVHFFADYAGEKQTRGHPFSYIHKLLTTFSPGNKSHPNHFSQDIVNLLYNKTGAHPHIRVGGTSALVHQDPYLYQRPPQSPSILILAQRPCNLQRHPSKINNPLRRIRQRNPKQSNPRPRLLRRLREFPRYTLDFPSKPGKQQYQRSGKCTCRGVCCVEPYPGESCCV